MKLFNVFAALFLTNAALAVPTLQNITSISKLRINDDSDCNWEDQWGVYDCNTYLITLGAIHPPSTPKNYDVAKTHVTIRNHKFLLSGNLFCGTRKKGDHGAWQDYWTTFDHQDLPTEIRIHGGHACTTEYWDDNWDNVWIEWDMEDGDGGGNGKQHVDVPSDERCGNSFLRGWGLVGCYVQI
ncbi:hypothetical protein B0T20DRAFT_497837 [Sordaria brevicollis]|uniref:Uncharacterized protein n=1 Tax=Sordaria brevicollis TaxID=83679 RepID=A0AAE0PGC4_SORBR|nr:hypothetical protein B0T20DRAFT_497837 [Sordaria brevicollis]